MSPVLRRALDDAGLTEDDVAARLGVDPKTVRRWIGGRVPYPRHRAGVANLLGTSSDDLWPYASTARESPNAPINQVPTTYAHRSVVPRTVWQSLFVRARREIGFLAYSALFLAEDAGIRQTIAQQARQGVAVRILLGNPDSPHVTERGIDEGIGESMAAKIRNSLVLFRPLGELDGVEIRLHGTVLYNSIYRADEELLVNPHAYGVPASQAPVLHVRRVETGDMASTYLDSFERVWQNAERLTRCL